MRDEKFRREIFDISNNSSTDTIHLLMYHSWILCKLISCVTMQRSRDRSCERRVSADDFVINHFYEVHSLLQFIHRARERYNDNILLAKHLRNVWQFIEL